MTVRAITIDFWGTLLFDSPARDNRYKTPRMKDFETILAVPPTVDDGASKALRTLCGLGYTLAVVSNTMRTPGATLRRLLEQYGLLACFAHTVFSDETGVRKPDPAIFLGALRALGADPARAIHVGDDAILDVEGARAAGMRVVQVTSASTSSVGGRRPDAVVPTLAALPDAIARLDR